MNRKIKMMKWIGMGIFAAGAAALTMGSASAHVSNLYGTPACGPHGSPNSGSGSYFSNCQKNSYCLSYTKKGACNSWQHLYSRDWFCEAGTKCALKTGCTSTAAYGTSSHDSKNLDPHGANGGHFPSIDSASCL